MTNEVIVTLAKSLFGTVEALIVAAEKLHGVDALKTVRHTGHMFAAAAESALGVPASTISPVPGSGAKPLPK